MSQEPIPLHKREDLVKRSMLDRLENISDDLSSRQEKLKTIGDLVLEQIEEAVRDKTITPYKGAVAYSKCVESWNRIANVHLSLYDRLSGTVGLFGKAIEMPEVEEEEVDIEIQRQAEALVVELVREDLLRSKKQG